MNKLEQKQLRMRTHGWFQTPNRDGDRTLSQQLGGLQPFLAEVRGKSVLDVGCAEGLISIEAAYRGAREVHGVEIVSGHVAIADGLKGDLPITFSVGDANDYQPDRTYDVVLLLAVLHKLRHPAQACDRLARAASDLCVIRLGPIDEPIIRDARTDFQRFEIGAVMESLGFVNERVERGPFEERTWYWRRPSSASVTP